jgi:hypothetical protein
MKYKVLKKRHAEVFVAPVNSSIRIYYALLTIHSGGLIHNSESIASIKEGPPPSGSTY